MPPTWPAKVPLSVAVRRLTLTCTRRRVQTVLFALVVVGLSRGLHAQRTVAEQYLFQALNASRQEAGLPALGWSDQLRQAAAQHADAMRDEQSMAHQLDHEPELSDRVSASGLRFFAVAENLGTGPTALELHRMWLQSPGHRGNMLDPDLNAVGIAVSWSGGELWAVEDFAGTSAEMPLAEQESRVQQLLQATGISTVATEAARSMCQQSNGYVGTRPAFVMRFNATGLSELPVELLDRIGRGKVSQAAVGACQYPQHGFSSYSIAVALYR
ncbi:MAG: CAP domain-containing protein [Janthinobacterium lividum]